MLFFRVFVVPLIICGRILLSQGQTHLFHDFCKDADIVRAQDSLVFGLAAAAIVFNLFKSLNFINFLTSHLVFKVIDISTRDGFY